MDRKNAERRAAAKDEIDSLIEYRKVLQEDYQDIFDRLLGYAKEHAGACARARKMKLSETILLAIVMEQEKRIDTLSAERGDPRNRKPASGHRTQVTEHRIHATEHGTVRSRPQDVDLFALFNRTELKEYPPWVVC